MMRSRAFAAVVCLNLILLALAVAGCGSFEVAVSFQAPAALTATAVAETKPDLGKIAYVDLGDIWIRQLPDGKPRRLTQVGQDSEPRWSPSGEWLAFREDSHLWVERADGTGARVVDGGAAIGQFAWSPTEDRLAYTAQGGLSMETADGSRLWTLVRASATGTGIRDIAWSPNGHWIAFDRDDRHRQGLWRIAAGGGSPRTVYRDAHPLQTQSYLAGWSPDGKYLLFWQGHLWSSSLLADGAPLLSVPVTGGRPRTLGDTLLHPEFLSWSPDGRHLALVQGGGRFTWENKALAIATAQGGLRQLQVAHPRGVAPAYLYPAWSPDGRWIAVTRGPAAPSSAGGDVAGTAVESRHIWLIAPDGSSARQLTNSSSRDERPEWSADGSAILFVRLGGKFAQLWLMQADGSQQHLVADGLFPAPVGGWWGYYGYVDWGQLYDWWTDHTS